MKTRQILLSVLCLFALVFSSRAVVYTHENVPSPKGYNRNNYVANPDTVLSLEVEQGLNDLCTRLHTNTGVELAVVAVGAFDENRYTAHDFALELFNYWGIGDEERNTGLLLFLARDSRDVQIITGDGIAGIMTDGKCGEMLDDNLGYFSANNFDGGMVALCTDIEEYLMEPENRSELMLGWVPEDTIVADVFLGWIFIGFIVMILLAWVGYKHLRGKPGEPEIGVLKQAEDAQWYMGCLSFLFPIPMLFLYLFYRFFPKHPQMMPMLCKQCGHTMESVPMELSPAQLKEQELKVFGYIRWRCPECGKEETVKSMGINNYRYRTCTACRGKTMLMTDVKVITRATYMHSGKEIDTYTCQCCGKVEQVNVILPQKHFNSGGDSSDSSGSSGSSGSWGGGHSSGGGAGRKF